MIKLIICENYDQASEKASQIIIEEIKSNPKITLGLATGSTPIGTYKKIIESYNKNEISFKEVRTFNLDEYVGLDSTHPQSYHYFMFDNLFNHVDIDKNNVHIPYVDINDKENSCKQYNELLNKNQIDLQLLGIGANGHIGFNEPNTSFNQETFIVDLTKKTREDNKRFFNSIDEVPTQAITMGIKNIMNAKKIILIATGDNKKEAVKTLLSNKISEEFPASALHLHNDVTVIIDKEAAKLL